MKKRKPRKGIIMKRAKHHAAQGLMYAPLTGSHTREYRYWRSEIYKLFEQMAKINPGS